MNKWIYDKKYRTAAIRKGQHVGYRKNGEKTTSIVVSRIGDIVKLKNGDTIQVDDVIGKFTRLGFGGTVWDSFSNTGW